MSVARLMRETRSDAKSVLHTARWLHEQLPIRFAQRIEEFLQLPHVVICNPHINSTLNRYLETYEVITDFPDILTSQDEMAFAKLVNEQLVLHDACTTFLAEGYREVRQCYPQIQLDAFLNDLFTVRIACRILMENYIAMREPVDGCIGVVRQGMLPLSLVQSMATRLTDLASSHYGNAPELEFRGNPDCVLDYIPRHVGYMVRELLKNAIRATIERHQQNLFSLPPVVVELQQGDIHVIIKISDHGGGMPKRVQHEAWQYGWTTAGVDSPQQIAGYGFGLPLSRLHAQYFGGDLFMQALPGHGTDMYLLLTHLKQGSSATEMEDPTTVVYQKRRTMPPASPVCDR